MCYPMVHKPEHFYIEAMDVWGMVENTLVGSYCLLACHHDDVMMIAILKPWMYQIMFKNRLFPTINWYHLHSDTEHYKHCTI